MDRRTTIKWMLAAAASVPALQLTFANDGGTAARAVTPDQAGYGTDPDLTRDWKPGGPWPLTLAEDARLATAALCDLIIPADDVSPAASSVGVVDFIDEWISAPYPQQRGDREIVLAGLVWLDAESRQRFGALFAALSAQQQAAIADDICDRSKAAARFADGARFFARFRDLTAGGFYTTPVGMKDIGYVGNVPLERFEGPPLAVMKKVGVA